MQWSRTLLIIITVAAVGLASFAAGLSYGTIATRGEAEVLLRAERERVRALEEDLGRVQAEFDRTSLESKKLQTALEETRLLLSQAERRSLDIQTSVEKDLEELRRQGDELSRRAAEADSKLQRITEQAKIVSQAVPLLNQLKGVEQLGPDRNSTLNYWLDVKSLTASFDPALTPSVDRVINNIDGLTDYYNWIDQFPGENASGDQILRWFLAFPPSYQQYVDAVNRFVDEVLTSLTSKLTALRDSLS
jgi:archaellum component FlaC